MKIREFDPARDAAALRACFVELQDRERQIDPRMPTGDRVADAYLERLFERTRGFAGVVLVAETETAVAGYVALWTQYRSREPDDDPAPLGYVADLVVLASQRRQGIGRALLGAAEARARAAGAPCLRLSVKAGNTEALALYAAEGFVEIEHTLEKPLA